MAKRSSKLQVFWRADWFAGIAVVIAAVALHLETGFVGTLESRFYGVASVGGVRQSSEHIVEIGINDQSIANIGPWPWPRDRHAKSIDRLAAAGAKTIAHTALFPLPQVDPGLQFIRKIKPPVNAPADSQTPNAQLVQLISPAEQTLDPDTKLAAIMRVAGNVILSSTCIIGEPPDRPDGTLPSYAARGAIEDIIGHSIQAQSGQQPFEALGIVAAGVSHLNQLPDVDGSERTEPMQINFYGKVISSTTLLTAAHSLGLNFERKRQFNKAEAVYAGLPQRNSCEGVTKQEASSVKVRWAWPTLIKIVRFVEW